MFILLFLEVSLFPSIVCTIFAFYLYGEYVVRSCLSFRMVFFYFVTTGWVFDTSLSRENSINQSYLHKI